MDRSNSGDRQKALDAALTQIERAFGKGSIMKLSGGQNPIAVEAVSTGSLGLDIALGIGGLPRGRITEIYGPESWARRRWRSRSSPRRKKAAAPAPSSTRNTRSTRPTRRSWASISTTSSSPSPTRANRRWRSRTL